MSREYILSAGGLTLANAAVTLAFINPGTTASLEILRCWVSQATNPVASSQQRVQLNTQVSVFPTLVTATPAKTKLSDPASVIVGGTAGAAGTAGVNASAEGNGTKTAPFPDAFNHQNGWMWVSTPRETFIMNAGAASGFGIHFPVASTSLANWQVGIVYAEL